jgi:hypothetical protein
MPNNPSHPAENTNALNITSIFFEKRKKDVADQGMETLTDHTKLKEVQIHE